MYGWMGVCKIHFLSLEWGGKNEPLAGICDYLWWFMLYMDMWREIASMVFTWGRREGNFFPGSSTRYNNIWKKKEKLHYLCHPPPEI